MCDAKRSVVARRTNEEMCDAKRSVVARRCNVRREAFSCCTPCQSEVQINLHQHEQRHGHPRSRENDIAFVQYAG